MHSDSHESMCFAKILGRDIQTHTDTWTHRQTFQHIGLIDLEGRSQWLVPTCIQTGDTTNWKDNHFSQALIQCKRLVEQIQRKKLCWGVQFSIAQLRAVFNVRQTVRSGKRTLYWKPNTGVTFAIFLLLYIVSGNIWLVNVLGFIM